ncbi:rod shape-determining protein MreD [Bacillus sp. Marseille-P3661]|uniref:rod shape-determining protein MreD n=1 Tax=Bacillus sp. Marseille-P3661 TaxID=1936234 RepID=UPI000C84466A|nr:rod shape-determining protein MreD [Bacillus sp. Marseille-P3661]
MRRFLLPFIIFIAFISESSFVELTPLGKLEMDRIFVPRFTIILIMLVTFFYDRNKAIVYSIIAGLLYDVIYTDIIGVYMFSFPLVIYIISYTMKVLHVNIFVVFLITVIGIGLLETIVYGLYYLVNVAPLDWNGFLYNRLLPTAVLNAVFIILVYYPMKQFLTKLEKLSMKDSV